MSHDALLKAWMYAVRIFAVVPILWMFAFLHYQGPGRGDLSDAAFNGVMFVLWGTFHSATARSNAKRFVARFIGQDAVRSAYVVASGVTLAVVLWLWRPLSGMVWQTEGALFYTLTGLYVICIAGMFYIARFFDRAEFFGIRIFLRRLKNRPPRPQAFSAEGPYAYCRHPMYLLLFCSLWIGPTMSLGRLEFALLASIYLMIGTYLEERNLREELGEVYDTYRAHVPMWLPRLTPWKQQPGSASQHQAAAY